MRCMMTSQTRRMRTGRSSETRVLKIHGLSTRAASDRVRTVRRRIEPGTAPGHLSIAYHAEPFDVACNMVGHDIRREDHQDAYWRIVAWHDLDENTSAALRDRRSPPFS
jgi:hypothetical protein